MASSGSSDDGTLLDEKEAPPPRLACDPAPSAAAAAPGHYCTVMDDDDDEGLWWSPFPDSKVTPAAAPSSSAAPPAAPPQPTRGITSEEDLGAFGGGRHAHDDRAPPAAILEPSSPMDASSNNHVNVTGFRVRQNNGRFVPHPHGGRGGGYNGSRRPVGGANGDRGDVNVHVHINGNEYDNFNGSGGFNNNNNGQRRGGRHWHGQGGHRPSGPRMQQPPPRHPPRDPTPPPFMGMVYYDPYGAYGPYAYSAEFAPAGVYFPPTPQERLPFMPYPTLPMPMMLPHWEQQGTAFGPSSYTEQQQQAPETKDAPPTAEELQKSIRQQIEYYFSTNNLSKDVYLRQKMDENGWVPLKLIAGFPRVMAKSDDLDFIMTSVLSSDEVEVQDGKIRRRVGWEKYPLPARSN